MDNNKTSNPSEPNIQPSMDGINRPTSPNVPVAASTEIAKQELGIGDETDDLTIEAKAAELRQEKNDTSGAKPKVVRKSGIAAVVVVGVVIAAALAGVGYLAMMSTSNNKKDNSAASQDQTKNNEQNQQAPSQQDQSQDVTEQSLNEESKAVDDIVNELDKLEEVDPNDLSDSSLGF